MRSKRKKRNFFLKKTCENKNNTYLCAPKTNESWEVEIKQGGKNGEAKASLKKKEVRKIRKSYNLNEKGFKVKRSSLKD